MANANDVLRVAKKEIGYKETGVNNTKYGKAYGMNGAYWCAIFLWWVFKEAGASKSFYNGKKSASTKELANYYQSKKQWNRIPQVGSFLFAKRTGVTGIGHIALVESMTASTVTTIEGNSGNAVKRVVRRKNDPNIVGYGHPPYTASSSGGTSSGGATAPAAGASDDSLKKALEALAKEKKYQGVVDTYQRAAAALGRSTAPIGTFTLADVPLAKDTISLFVSSVSGGTRTYYYLANDESSVVREVTYTTERKGTPGKLTFKLQASDTFKIDMGDAVGFSWGGKPVFFGFVFQVSSGTNGEVTVACYDQLRYLKNKESYAYKKLSTTSLLRMIARDFKLNLSPNIVETKVAHTRIEQDQTLADIIQTSIDLTLLATAKLYSLYDDYGKLTLVDIEKNRLDYVVCPDTVGAWDISSSIDSDVYNRVKVRVGKAGEGLKTYIAQSSELMNKWGVLQLTESRDSTVGAKRRAAELIAAYSSPKRTLRIKGALGDARVRAGVTLPVVLPADNISNYMVVERVQHSFKDGAHTMDLDLIGAGFDART